MHSKKGKITNCFSSDNEDGGVYFAPELTVEIKKGNLLINYDHGRYGSWKYTFRYQKNNFELIGYDTYIRDHTSGQLVEKLISINFLTQKMQTKTSITDMVDDREVEIENTEHWQDFKLTAPVTLTNIFMDTYLLNFDEVPPNAFAAQGIKW